MKNKQTNNYGLYSLLIKGVPRLLACFLSLLLGFNSFAQTLSVGATKYTFYGSTINVIAKDNAGNTYVGGSFSRVGLWSGHGAQINTTTGAPNTSFPKVAGGLINAVVAIPSGGWYIGGSFTAVNGINRNNLARINSDGTLHAFDPNMNSNVNALALDGSGNLYAGGAFTTIGGSTTRNRLCKFDNSGALSTWNPNMNNTVNALALDGSGNLYAGGTFRTVGGSMTRDRLCKFNNTGALSVWSPDMNDAVNALALDGSGNLYAGGFFTSAFGGIPRNYFCKFDNSGVLSAFDPNVNNWVYALALDGSGNLYVGGGFTSVGGSTRNRLCKFDNTGALTTFAPNISTTSSYVFALALDGSGNLYVGGGFTTIGGITRNSLCKFDNMGALTTFDPNMQGGVSALALDGSGNLYAGGGFTSVGGGTTRNHLCKFDNTGALTTWNPNMNNVVYALALDGSGNLYAGGQFTTVGGSRLRPFFCKFDNTGALAAFNPNIDNWVYALALDGSGNLYVGGDFTTVGGSTTRNRLCKFSNTGTLTTWDPNMNNTVSALALDGSGNLYAGGTFTTVGGSTTRNRLCKFDNTGALTTWNPNMNNTVNALALDGSGNLYAGGTFNSPSSSLAVFSSPCITAYNLTGGGAYCVGGSGVAVGLTNSETGVSYQLMLGGSNVGSPVAGTGSAISFVNQTTAGIYTVVGTSTTGGCTATMTGSATVTANPTLSTSSFTNVACFGATSGSFTVIAIGGTAPFSYNRGTGGQVSGTFGPVAAGNYSVTLTDGNGCTASTGVTITQPSQLTATLSSNSPQCGNVLLTAGGGTSYNFGSGFSASNTNSVTVSGSYSVTVQDANGCTASASTTVTSNTIPPSVTVSPSSATLTCAITTVQLSATGGTSYIWSNGQTTSTISANTAGLYRVTLTSANGCTSTGSASVSAAAGVPQINITPSSTQLSCVTTSVTLTANGANTYQWENGVTTASRAITAAGTYTVTGTNTTTGCTASQSIVITNNTSAPIAPLLTANQTCTSAGNPATFSIASYTPTLTYTLVNSLGVTIGTFTSTQMNVANSGTYTVRCVNPSNGCQSVSNRLKLFNNPLCGFGATSASGIVNLQAPNHGENASETVGIESESWNVYPNPTSEKLFVQFDFEEDTEVQLAIFSVDGRQIWKHQETGRSNTVQINVTDFPSGQYFIRLSNKDKVQTKAIQIVR